MKRFITASLSWSAALMISLPAGAQTSVPDSKPEANPLPQFSNCMVDHTSGRERKDLAQWIFLAMAQHPEIKQFAAPDVAEAAVVSDKKFAKLVTRLITDECANEAKAAYAHSGTMGIEAGFQSLGAGAMRELMNDPAVKAGVTNYARYLDSEAIGRLLTGK